VLDDKVSLVTLSVICVNDDLETTTLLAFQRGAFIFWSNICILRPGEGLPLQLLVRVVFGCFALSRVFVLLTFFVVIYTKEP